MNGIVRAVGLPILIGFFLLAAYLYYHLGAWQEVAVEFTHRPSFVIAYKVHRGPYHKINTVIEEVEKWAAGQSIPCPRSVGEYLDDPRLVDEDRLTSHGGCILDKEPAGTNSEVLTRVVAEQDYVRAEFSGSPAIGPWKVYPRMRDFIEKNDLTESGGIFEIYKIEGNNMTTEYLWPVRRKK